MAIEDVFAELYTKHVYKNGMVAGASNLLDNPRGLANAVEYGGTVPGGSPYPYRTAVVSGVIEYGLGGGPSASALDELPPSYILQHTIPDIDQDFEMVEASLIEPKNMMIPGTDIRRFYPRSLPDVSSPGDTILTGSRASSVLRDLGRIP